MQEESICHTMRLLVVTPSKDLSLSQREQLQQHLAECIECADMQREYEALRKRIRYAAAQEPVPDFSALQLFNLRQMLLARRAILVAGLTAGVTVLGGVTLWTLLASPISPLSLGGSSVRCVPLEAMGSIASDGLITSGVFSWGADPGKGDAFVSGAAPYVFYDANGDLVGFEVDIANAIARLMEVTQVCYPANYKWDIENDLQARKMDVILNGWEITPGRELNENFSDPYYRYSQQLVVRANDSRFSQYTASSKITLTELKSHNYKFGTGSDYKAADLLRNAGINPYTADKPLDALKNGTVDIIMIDMPIVAYYVQGKGKGATRDNALRAIGEPLFADSMSNYVIGFKKDDPNADVLLSEINQALRALKQDGTLKRIYQDWGLWNDFQKEIGVIDCS